MKKITRFGCLVLVVCLLLSMIPVTAGAASDVRPTDAEIRWVFENRPDVLDVVDRNKGLLSAVKADADTIVDRQSKVLGLTITENLMAIIKWDRLAEEWNYAASEEFYLTVAEQTHVLDIFSEIEQVFSIKGDLETYCEGIADIVGFLDVGDVREIFEAAERSEFVGGILLSGADYAADQLDLLMKYVATAIALHACEREVITTLISWVEQTDLKDGCLCTGLKQVYENMTISGGDYIIKQYLSVYKVAEIIFTAAEAVVLNRYPPVAALNTAWKLFILEEKVLLKIPSAKDLTKTIHFREYYTTLRTALYAVHSKVIGNRQTGTFDKSLITDYEIVYNAMITALTSYLHAAKEMADGSVENGLLEQDITYIEEVCCFDAYMARCVQTAPMPAPMPESNYNAAAAVAYADEHWNDGKGLCAEFVCDCLAAGGVIIPDKSYFKSVDASYRNCDGNLGAYVNPYIAVPALLKYLGEVAGYTVIANPKESQMEVGDVVCMYPSEIGKNPDGHVVIITKVENGEAYFSAHNTDRYNRAVSENWCSFLIKMNGKTGGSVENAKTQYRYHIYVNQDGARYICPYYGQTSDKYYGTTFTIRYTEWLDEPLPVDNGTNNYYTHPRHKDCVEYGCIDDDYDGDRYRDANGLTWFYQETRQIVDTSTVTVNFTDVQPDAYYEDPVRWAVAKDITVGTSATAFSPQNLCTRAQIITFLWRAVGSPKATMSNPFTDVKAGDYYYDAAIWAYQKGMVSGTTFAGNTPCTRADTVVYLWKYAGSPTFQVTNIFVDVLVGSEYAQAVAWAVANGVTAGTSTNTFSPDNTCTRGQIVTFLYRCVGK